MVQQLSLFDVRENSQKSNQETKYLSLEGDIPLDLKNGSIIALNREIPLKIYSLGFQPAKSIPEIPRWFLDKYIKPSVQILEPFAGSGTTIINFDLRDNCETHITLENDWRSHRLELVVS